MSDVQTRPPAPRGRGSHRGSRGGSSLRGGRGRSRQTNGTRTEDLVQVSSNEDEGEMGDLKRLYAPKLGTVKEMFPNWTDEDIVTALQETDGDLEATIERISEGKSSQWGEVKKKTKERSQSKVKEPAPTSTEAAGQSTRGGRGRGGSESTRGTRGRGTDRGRGAARGGRGGLTNGHRDPQNSKKEDASNTNAGGLDRATSTDATTSGWDSTNADSTPLESSWENISAEAARPPAAEEPKPSSKPDGTRSWASMFSKPAPAPAPKAPHAAPSHDEPVQSSVPAPSMPIETDMPGLPPPPVIDNVEIPSTPPEPDLPLEPAANITPSKDDLTETNLEQVPDISAPPPAATAASTVASTLGPEGGLSIQTSQNARPPLGGYATSAYKATGMPAMGRSASYQRKILEQREAVVMPEKHAVDRAAVQFGSMGLNGTTEDEDVDSDREDAETRAQPPQHSPIAPRAALPPAPQQIGALQAQVDSQPTPRQAPGLPPVQQPNHNLPTESGLPSQPQSSYPYNRYGNQAAPQDVSAPPPKPYEPFGQQVQQPHQQDTWPPGNQVPGQTQQSAQAQHGQFSSAANDLSSNYTSDNQRNAYQGNYFGNQSQQPQQNSQESSAFGQRGTSAFGTPAADQATQFAPGQAQQQPQSRYGQLSEAQNSGHSTPNPSTSGQQQANQPHQMLQQQQAQGQAGGQHGQFPYGHPYYGSPYYSAYMNQFGYGANQGAYGGPFGGAGGKQGMYGQPHQGYGISPQASYDQQHSASPANAGAFGQQHSGSGRDSAAAGGLGNYGRSGSAQPSENPQQFGNTGSGAHGHPSDVFGRSQSGYQGQSAFGGHSSQQGGNEDSLRSFNDSSKVPGGPSPALGQPSGRPGSTVASQTHSGLPPPQGQSQGQQSYGGYMGQMHNQGGSQYGGGPGGLGGHHQYGGQNHQAAGYGGYGAGYGSSNYGSNNRGGWGANYGH